MANQDSIRTEIEEFMDSPLVVWFQSCLEGIIEHKVTFEELVDGVLMYNVFLKMDIHGQTNDVAPPNNNHVQCLKNLETIMRNMRLFYEEDSVVLREPELRLIARAAHSNLHDVELLLILLLGCAVKCPNKKYFIERITLLEEPTQQAIASHIEKVTHFPEVVLCRDMLLVETTDLDDESDPEEQTFHAQKVYKAFDEIRRINKERIELIERTEAAPPPNIPHCILELNEWKSKALQLRNIEEEYTQELQKYAERVEVLEKENTRLVSEAKAAKEYRDALDATMEKALQADRLEQEVTRFKEKLEHLDSCKSRLEELKQDNKLLNENKEELVAQLTAYKSKADKMMEIEVQMYKLKEQCDTFALERDAFKDKLAELSNVNDELERRVNLSASISGAFHSSRINESNESLNTSFDNSICEQLSHSINSRVLQLELENRRLAKLVESQRESSFHESSFKILNLKKEKGLELANENLTAKVTNLEDNTTDANKAKMQQRVLLENAQKLSNDEMELKVILLESEKRKVLRDLEKTQAALKEKFTSLEASSKIIKELQIKLQALEKQRKLEQENEDELSNSSILKSQEKHAILYNRLMSDLQRVSDERNSLRAQVKKAQLKIKQLESAVQRLQAPGSPHALRQEYAKLKHDFMAVITEYRKTKSVCDELTKRHGEDQLEMRAKNVRIIELDLQNSKLQHKCELLNQLNERVETDKAALMDYVSQMLKQNHELVAQTIEDKEHYFEEERKNNETVNNLSRAKEKLEEKIMDQFRRMDNSKRQVKKRSAAVNAMKNTFVKVRRAGSEFFGRSRKSWSDDNSCPTEKSDDFEFSRPSDVSEIYVNLPRNRKSVDFMDDFEPEHFTFDEKNNNC